ncbi:MAG: hypothetical protein IJ362_05775 [Oscillospiraceae bacterium]|nr:hypothetical protein [Oscillospiraceae bacterium]
MKLTAKILLFIFICFGLCGCSQEEVIEYNLNIISPSFENVYIHYKSDESETDKYVLQPAADYAELLTEETLPRIKSVTVCDESISTETAQNIVNICQSENIPVFFLMNDIDREIIGSYDKAFCISADYTYIGEMFATKINEMWENEIIDKNGDHIFTFSVVQPETMNNIQQSFYSSVIANIELLGIPLEQLEEIYLSKGDVLGYCEDNKKKNESFFILESDYMSVFPDVYAPYGEGVEILGIAFGIENSYAQLPYMKLCFIDYSLYFNARDAVLSNIENKVYPFKNLDYSIIDKYMYIQPVI